jgi:hypothetical protein
MELCTSYLPEEEVSHGALHLPNRKLVLLSVHGPKELCPCLVEKWSHEALYLPDGGAGPGALPALVAFTGTGGVYRHWWRLPALVAQCVKGLLPR